MNESPVQDEVWSKPILAALFLNWNDHKEVVRCLDSIRTVHRCVVRPYVIDNGSSFESVAYIRDRFPDVPILENGENLGFSGGFNVGIRRALQDHADVVCVLNTDLVFSHDFFERLADAFDDPGVAAAAPKALDYYFPERILFAGGNLDPVIARVDGFGEVDGVEFSIPHDTRMLCGPAMVFRSSVLRKLGGFDEKLFYTAEDQEMTLRLQRSKLRIRYVPAAKVWHKGGGSAGGGGTPLTAYFSNRNYLLVALEYGTFKQKLAAVAMVVLIRYPRFLKRALLTKNPLYITGLVWSVLWFLNPARVPPDPLAVEQLLDRGLLSVKTAHSSGRTVMKGRPPP